MHTLRNICSIPSKDGPQQCLWFLSIRLANIFLAFLEITNQSPSGESSSSHRVWMAPANRPQSYSSFFRFSVQRHSKQPFTEQCRFIISDRWIKLNTVTNMQAWRGLFMTHQLLWCQMTSKAQDGRPRIQTIVALFCRMEGSQGVS